MKFSGNRDTDLLILLNIPDNKDFLSLCRVNTYIADLCKDENLFRQRLNEYFPAAIKFKPLAENWKEYYLKTVYYVDKLANLGFTYSDKSNGLASEYYYILNDRPGNLYRVFKLQLYDLFLFIYHTYEKERIYHWKSEIFKYFDIKFIKEHFTSLFQPDELHHGRDTLFRYALQGGKLENFMFLWTKFPNGIVYRQPNLACAGNGNNKEIIEILLSSFGRTKSNLLCVVLGAYEEYNIELGNYYFNQIDVSNGLDLDSVQTYDNFLDILVKSGNNKLLLLAIKEMKNMLLDVINDDVDTVYKSDFELSFDDLLRRRNKKLIKKLLQLGGYVYKNIRQLIQDADINADFRDKLLYLAKVYA